MKHLSKIALYFLITALSLTACGAKHSELHVSPTTGGWTVESSDDGGEYLYMENNVGEKVIQVFCYDKLGNLTELSLEDCAEIKNRLPVISGELMCGKDELKSKAPNVSSRGSHSFEAEEAFTALGAGEKFSADYEDAAMISIQPTAELGYVVGGLSSGSAAVNGAVASGAGFAWHTYLPILCKNGLTIDLPEDKIVYLRFVPYLNVARGTVDKESDAWCVSPIATAAGGADGLLEVVVR